MQPDVPAPAEVFAAMAVARRDDDPEAGSLRLRARHVDPARVHVVGDVLNVLAEQEQLDLLYLRFPDVSSRPPFP